MRSMPQSLLHVQHVGVAAALARVAPVLFA
jgi:hypothetical protein